MTDIPKMLRSEALIADEDWTGIYGISPNLAFAAAARIEKLEAENEELQSKVGTVRLAAKYAAKIRDDRIEKLEAALRNIVEQIESYDLPAPVVTLLVLQKARKALEGKDD